MEKGNYKINNDRVEHEMSLPKRYSIQGALYGAACIIVAWFIQISTSEFSGIIDMHFNNPVLFFVDLAPAVLALLAYFVAKNIQTIREELYRKVHELNMNIQKNANFAKMIGEKDFSVNANDISESDELGQALMLMKNNLVEANKKETELNWIAEGKDKISNILRLHNNINTLAYETLVTLINYTNTIQGSFYIFDDDNKKLQNISTYAYNRKKYISQEFNIGEGLIGQAAYEMDYIYRREIPEDYVSITSGILGDKKPATILIVPLISDEKLQGILEFASLEESIPELTIKFVKELAEIIAQTVFNLKVNARTEKLLKEARIMTEELQENEEELRQNAEEMRATQEELQKTNKNLEAKVEEVENAQKRLHSLLENASEVISIYDEEGIIKYESPSVKHILGYSPEDVIGKNAFDTVHTSENDPTKQTFLELLENPTIPKTFEFQYEKNEDEVLWLETTGRNFLNNPAINGIIFNTRDITVRKIAEKAQRMSGQMQALSENSPDLIMRISLEGKFFYANPRVELFTGIKTKDIIRKNVDELPLESSVKELFKKTIETVATTKEKIEKEIEFPSIHGKKIMLFNAIPEFSEDKDMETILIVAHDITEQKEIEQVIIEKNKQITDSINYAKRIQNAILPDNKLIREFLPESFVFYKPRDVVSGDFPWFFQKGDNIYIAVVDCTGHGVPGAMLSFIGYFILNSIVDHDREITAGQILDLLHEGVRSTLKQDKEGANARDGMDIAFCKISKSKKELQFAGAHRPLYLLREGEIKQFKGNRKAIGGIPFKRKPEPDFVNYSINYASGDKFFFFSDGLPDQIGSDDGRKYQSQRIRDLILENHDNSMGQFAKLFARDFNTWKGNFKQIDDVLLIGLEF